MGLTAAMYLSCVAVALSVFQIPKEISSTGSIPVRIFLLLLGAVSIWGLVAYFSDEPAWKTVGKLVSYTVVFCFVSVAVRGLNQFFSHDFDGTSELITAVGLIAIGVTGTLVVGKLINSKLLN